MEAQLIKGFTGLYSTLEQILKEKKPCKIKICEIKEISFLAHTHTQYCVSNYSSHTVFLYTMRTQQFQLKHINPVRFLQ